MKKPIKFKKIAKVLLLTIIGLVVLGAAAIGIAYYKQDDLLAKAVSQLNESFAGKFEVEGSHISPFENFPYISIDLDHVKVYQDEAHTTEAAIDVQDVYVGFDLWSIITGSFEVKKIKLSNGTVKLIQNEDGSLNVAKAFKSPDSNEADPDDDGQGSTVSFNLKSIELENIDLLKYHRASDILAEVYIEKITSSFAMSADHIKADLDSKMLFNLIINGDTSFLHHKHLTLNTGIDYDLNSGVLAFTPSELQVETASFLMEGSINVKNDMDLDLKFSGEKRNFDLFLAFAPPELAPIFARYDNGGKVYFNAVVQGPSNTVPPHVEVNFGCEAAFVENTEVAKALDELFFKGHFTNGAQNNASTMELVVQDFRARPETGTLQGSISVKNFEAPDIQMKVNTAFNLDFLAQFLNIERLEDLSGTVVLDMNFHDIIDLDDPTKTIEQLNESYYTELKVEDLSFKSRNFHLPFSNINIHAAMDGHKAVVDQFTVKVGNSDLSFTGTISDLPAILHHTNLPVTVNLNVQANRVDLLEFTQTDSLTKGFNEQIKDLSLGLKFNSSARAFTESPNLPLGEFFVTKLHAQLTNYPHELHDFNVDIIIDSTDFKVVDFTGMLDKSDFHFDGKLSHYDLWFQENPVGASVIDFNLKSKLVQLTDLFSYGGENYVPEEYRTEEFRNFKFHGLSKLQFNNKLTSASLDLDLLSAQLQQHAVRLDDFKGHIELDSSLLVVQGFGGQIGRSKFTTDLTYYLNADSTTAPHSLYFKFAKLDFDQLFSYAPPPARCRNRPGRP